MKTSIATVSINGTLKEKIQAIAKAGFDGVEIFENDFLTNNLSPKEVKKLVKDNGLEIHYFSLSETLKECLINIEQEHLIEPRKSLILWRN